MSSRSDGDTWDIATSVGATAVMVASARATETASEQPLIRDEFARMLIDGPQLADLQAKMAATYTADPQLEAVRRHMVNYQAAPFLRRILHHRPLPEEPSVAATFRAVFVSAVKP